MCVTRNSSRKPCNFVNQDELSLDCEQSLFFFRLGEGSARALERRETRVTRARLAPLVTRVDICVSLAFFSKDQVNRETARSLSRVRVGISCILEAILLNNPRLI